jgi:hypothetical protein
VRPLAGRRPGATSEVVRSSGFRSSASLRLAGVTRANRWCTIGFRRPSHDGNEAGRILLAVPWERICGVMSELGPVLCGPSADVSRSSAVLGQPSAEGSKQLVVVGRASAGVSRELVVVSRASVVVGRASAVASRASAVVSRELVVVGRTSAVVSRASTDVGRPPVIVGKPPADVSTPSAVPGKRPVGLSRASGVPGGFSAVRGGPPVGLSERSTAGSPPRAGWIGLGGASWILRDWPKLCKNPSDLLRSGPCRKFANSSLNQ